MIYAIAESFSAMLIKKLKTFNLLWLVCPSTNGTHLVSSKSFDDNALAHSILENYYEQNDNYHRYHYL